MIKIKVCGMTDPVNTEAIAVLPVDYMGFLFYPGSERYVGGSPGTALFDSVAPGIIKTGVFVDADFNLITGVARKYHLDMIQLHGNEGTAFCRDFYREGFRIIKAFKVRDDFDFSLCDEYMAYCDYFLFDTASDKGGGSGKKFDWGILDGYKSGKPFFLSGGICEDDAKLIRETAHPDLYAVDINSRFEIRPGLKDAEKIRRFIKILKPDIL